MLVSLFVCLFGRVAKVGLMAGDSHEGNKNSVTFNMVYLFNIVFRIHLQLQI
jgi:hypothetical protein